jgi:hypothetical protein
MTKLYINRTDRTPEINFEYGKLCIFGTFVPENPYEFYSELYNWIKFYSKSPATETIVNVGIAYTRGFAMEYIEALLQEVVYLNDEEHRVIVNWYFSPSSIDKKAGEYLSWKLEHPFNFVEVEEIR